MKIKSLVINKILPKVVYLPWLISWLILSFLSILRSLFLKVEKSKNRNSQICIEAGHKGWESIELQELYQSAVEYLGDNNVKKLSIDHNAHYFREVKKLIHNNNITHYFL
mgnify:CR=1 FL=1